MLKLEQSICIFFSNWADHAVRYIELFSMIVNISLFPKYFEWSHLLGHSEICSFVNFICSVSFRIYLGPLFNKLSSLIERRVNICVGSLKKVLYFSAPLFFCCRIGCCSYQVGEQVGCFLFLFSALFFSFSFFFFYMLVLFASSSFLNIFFLTYKKKKVGEHGV